MSRRLSKAIKVNEGVGKVKEPIEILDESDGYDSESSIDSLGFGGSEVKVGGKGGGGVKDGVELKAASKKKTILLSKMEEEFQTVYHNDIVWACFRALGSLSSQMVNKDDEEELAYIECMLMKEENPEVVAVGKEQVGKGVKGLLFHQMLPFLLFWILDEKRSTTTGWLLSKKKLTIK